MTTSSSEEETPNRRIYWSRLDRVPVLGWIKIHFGQLFSIGVVIYVVVRFGLAFGFLREHHVNPWIFGAIDIVTAVPYGYGMPKMMRGLIDKNVDQFLLWATVVLGSFLPPYIYLFWFGQDIPSYVYAVVALFVVIAAVFARRQYQQEKNNRHRAAADESTQT